MGSFVDSFITFLECISDESFWNAIFGERISVLLKRYFGNDVVFLGFIVYLARKLLNIASGFFKVEHSYIDFLQ